MLEFQESIFLCLLIQCCFLLQALGDLVESSVGAVLVDTGFDMNCVWKIMLSFIDPIMSFSGFQLSPIRDITEFCQNCGWKLKFNSSKMEGYYSVKA